MKLQHRAPKVFALSLFTVVCLAIFAWLYVAAGGQIRLHKPYTVKTIVPTAFQLVDNGDVRRAGVKIGRVTDITNRGGAGVVTMELKKDQSPIYKDATVQIRTKTLVGENYVDLNPGHPQAGKLPDGGTLPLERAQEAVQLDEILNSFDAATRARVKQDLNGFGPGLKNRGPDLNRLFAAMRPTVADSDQVVQILRGQKQSVAALLDDTARVMQAFADRTQQVRTLAVQAKATGEAVAARDSAFGQAIDQLAPTLAQARTSTAKLGSFAGRATPVMSNFRMAAHDLTPVMRDLEPSARLTRAVFAELPSAMKALDPALDNLDAFSRGLRPAVGSLDAFLRQMNPVLAYWEPYYREFGSFFANNGSMNDTHDALGARARVHGIFDESSYTGIDADTRRALEALYAAGGLDKAHHLDTNAYPKPGTVGSPQPASGDYPHVEAAGG